MGNRITLLVPMSLAEMRAIHRAHQIVSSATDGTDLEVQREYDSIASRLRRVERRNEKLVRSLRRQRASKSVRKMEER